MNRASLALLIFLPCIPAQAEMDHSEYEVAPAEMTDEEAAGLRARIAAEIAADRARSEAEARAREEALEADAARRAAQPLGQQLVDTRCAACHGADSYQNANLGRLGWQATVWRMDIIHNAGPARGEHGVLADWLRAQYPPSGGRAALEWLVLLLVAVALPLPLALRQHRKRKR